MAKMDERIVPFETKMDKTIKNLESELGTIRAGRANPHVLDRIMVDYYGAPTPLQQVANISVPRNLPGKRSAESVCGRCGVKEYLEGGEKCGENSKGSVCGGRPGGSAGNSAVLLRY